MLTNKTLTNINKKYLHYGDSNTIMINFNLKKIIFYIILKYNT